MRLHVVLYVDTEKSTLLLLWNSSQKYANLKRLNHVYIHPTKHLLTKESAHGVSNMFFDEIVHTRATKRLLFLALVFIPLSLSYAHPSLCVNWFVFQTMVRFHLAGNPVSHSEFLADELRIFTAGTEGATIEIERLKQFTKVCFSG